MFRLLLTALFLLLTMSGPGTASAKVLPVPAPEPVKPRTVLTHVHRESCEETAAEPVEIICILDRSGSMRSLAGDVIGGYNAFLEKQRQEPGTAEVTTVLFDDRYEKIVEAVDLQKAPALTAETYYARGMTALLDAIGRTVSETLGRMEKTDVCPAKRRVLVLIMTDGLENNSREYDKASVKALIDATTEEYGWNYIFMGANIDSVAEAAALGISADHAVDYAHDSDGVQESFSRMSAAAKEARESGSVSGNWKDGQ